MLDSCVRSDAQGAFAVAVCEITRKYGEFPAVFDDFAGLSKRGHEVVHMAEDGAFTAEHVAAGKDGVSFDDEFAAFHVGSGVQTGVAHYVDNTAEEALAAVVADISFNENLSAAHTFSAAAVTGAAVVSGVAVADDFAAEHLTAQPVTGVTHDLDGAAGHEVAAVHADVAVHNNAAVGHVLANPFDTGGVADDDNFGCSGSCGLSVHADVKYVGEPHGLVADIDVDPYGFTEDFRGDDFCFDGQMRVHRVAHNQGDSSHNVVSVSIFMLRGR